MRLYELTYLIPSELSEEEVKALQGKVNSFVLDEGGKLGKSENPIKKKLEYPIKKREGGSLATLNFYLKPGKLENLEKKVKKESSILRYLVLKKEVPEKIKIPKIKPKAEIKKEKKVKLEKIEEKLDEILGEI